MTLRATGVETVTTGGPCCASAAELAPTMAIAVRETAQVANFRIGTPASQKVSPQTICGLQRLATLRASVHLIAAAERKAEYGAAYLVAPLEWAFPANIQVNSTH